MHNLQNKRYFLRFSGERGQARGERGVRVASRLPPHACKTRKNNACSEQVLIAVDSFPVGCTWIVPGWGGLRNEKARLLTVLCVARGLTERKLGREQKIAPISNFCTNTTLSTTVVQKKCKSVRDNAER